MLSLVIPVYNEHESLEPLYAELDEVAREHGYELDIVFVDDGSTDGSWDVIEAIAGRDPRVRGLKFRRNFGKAAALDAGFRAARGQIVMTLDADLQDDPHGIPDFLAIISRGSDLVSGWKRLRHDPWHKVFPSRVFNAMVSRVTGVHLHDHNCGMKCYRQEVVQELSLYGEMHRFVPVLAAARGFRIGEVVVLHRARRFGHSKYGVRRFVKGCLDLLSVAFLTQFGHRPMHPLGTAGLGALAVALAGLFVLLVAGWAMGPVAITLVALASATGLLAATVLAAAGLLAELVVARSYAPRNAYAIAAQTPSHPDAADASRQPAELLGEDSP